MAAQSDFAQAKVFYNGSPITQITSMSMTTNAANQRVDLLDGGLAGFTAGSGDVTLEIGFVVPIGGLEFDYQQDCANHAFVDMQVFIGRQNYIGRGKIDTNQISQSVGASMEGSFTWVGELKPLA